MILVCGEALFDLFGTETATGFTFDARPGGSPFNVAIGLSRIGIASGLYGGLSSDFFGQKLLRVLQQEGVNTSRLVHLDAPTTAAFVSLGEGGIPSYAFRGEGGADRSLTSQDVDLTAVEVLHFGSYALVTEPTANVFAARITRCARRIHQKIPRLANAEPP